ncbi:TetR/AcrR family transcriptional regulator [Streptococcus suis]|nr:TetR/AcrR family transcriptional regulator [Streptococcus suis]
MERVKRKESLFVESVVEGLWELLEDKSFEKISVSELVERAGIGRVTFYRNFSNKEEVLKRSFNMELQAWLSEQQIDLSDWTDGQLLSALRQFFDFWYEQQDNIRFLICLTGILIALVAK